MGPDTNTLELDIGVGGMTCASCVMRVERALKKIPGVQDASVNLATESARVHYLPSAEIEARMRRAVRDAGYEPRTRAQADALDDASPWAGFLPVATGLLLCAPLVLPMLGDFLGRHWRARHSGTYGGQNPAEPLLGFRL